MSEEELAKRIEALEIRLKTQEDMFRLGVDMVISVIERVSKRPETDPYLSRLKSFPEPTGHPKSHPFPKAERFGAKGRTLAQLTGGIPACIKVTRKGQDWEAKCAKDGWFQGSAPFDDMWVFLRDHRDKHHPLGGKKEGA